MHVLVPAEYQPFNWAMQGVDAKLERISGQFQEIYHNYVAFKKHRKYYTDKYAFPSDRVQFLIGLSKRIYEIMRNYLHSVDRMIVDAREFKSGLYATAIQFHDLRMFKDVLCLMPGIHIYLDGILDKLIALGPITHQKPE